MQHQLHFPSGTVLHPEPPIHPTFPQFLSYIEIGNLVKHLGRELQVGDTGSVGCPSLYNVTTLRFNYCYAMQVEVFGSIGYGWYIVGPTPRQNHFNPSRSTFRWAVHYSNLDAPYLPYRWMGEMDTRPLSFH